MRGLGRAAEERQRLIAAYRSSGLSVHAFCERERVPESTLYGWLSGRGVGGAAPVRVARVIRTVSPPREAPPPHTPIVLQVGAIQVAVTEGFDRQTLGEVLDVITLRVGAKK